MKFYVASSWRNPYHEMALRQLTFRGHTFYNYRDSNANFKWAEIDPEWEKWSPEAQIQALDHPLSEKAFEHDSGGMDSSEACLLIEPSGRSAHLELGYMTGQGKPTFVWIPERFESELMLKIVTKMSHSLSNLMDFIDEEYGRLNSEQKASSSS